jgi:hypothetical protein
MTPLSNRPSQPPKTASLRQAQLEEPLTPAASNGTTEESLEETKTSEASASEATPLTPKRPLMRPVARPELPKTPPESPPPAKPAVPPAAAAPTMPTTPTLPPPGPTIIVDEVTGEEIIRMQPIPAPSEPMQYRAIGLLRGRYVPSDDQFTRGNLTTRDGTLIEAVLLGRVMSLIKNHLELEQEHLFVVYPRTREKEEDLHAQIVGVWEPEKLNKVDEPVEGEATEASVPAPPKVAYQPVDEVDDDYFSIRGEIVYHDPEGKSVVVKIQQSPRKKDDNKMRAFKLKLEGVLNGKVVGYFWDLQVRRQGNALVIEAGSPIAMIPPKKKPKTAFRGRPGGGKRDFARPGVKPRPAGAGDASGAPPAPKRDTPLPKPVKRQDKEAVSEPQS